ncbi:hypothetical protein CC85DRAFT_21165 [Cutaneotrichosporon oleaginosum]|uniref:Protein kinase domain-containing protein n=1 Tax=Cutaneotrichosporon oleaginosum TaxID=879819 RepID=A0A0J1ATK2_9TREE|nr:uncharacterized protein CC85DRAFT_21165 [Cutaneotrichosporon oleaginosum]KLT38644.1 hypothetical protein CC85DRAFT_21165 [Cutaneotrichosporon oleaginosum]TXT12767.1 hypothetical protein COLE_03177 [Cutaneotrichosporon oleaginosum]
MEVILALILSAVPSLKPDDLWHDTVALIDDPHPTKRKYEESEDEERQGPSRPGKKSTNRMAHPAERHGTSTLTISQGPSLFAAGDAPKYSVLPPDSDIHGTLHVPASELELVERVLALGLVTQSSDTSFSSDNAASLSLCTSLSRTNESTSSKLSVSIELSAFLGRGRTWDAFEATLAVHQLGAPIARIPAVVKHIDLACLKTAEHLNRGYQELSRVLNAVDRERDLLQLLDERAPGIAPQLYALWRVGDHFLLAMEHCGRAVTFDASTLDHETKRAIVRAYGCIHAAGAVHGDVQLRHLTRDRRGALRIVDWEGGCRVDPQSADGSSAIGREMDEVRRRCAIR